MRVLALCAVMFSQVLWAQVPQSRHVWIVTEENHSYEAVMGNPNMPYFNSLASKYALATQYYSEEHNSISALMWLVAGQPITGNNQTTSCFSADNVARHLIAQGLTWRSYQEDLPYPGFRGISNLNYVRRHNPIIDFTDTCAAGQAINSVPFSQLSSDIATHRTPNYAYITPNLLNDAHNGPLSAADAWLSQHVPAILALPEFQPGGDGILFIVWDEADLSTNGVTQDNRCSARISNGCGGRLATLVIGPQVNPGYRSTVRYDHANLLRTVCDALGLSACPGAAAVASPMSDVFNAVTIVAPFANAMVASPVHIQAVTANSSPVATMQLYVDGVLRYQSASQSLDTLLPMSLGQHYVVAQSWDAKGGIHKRGINVTVQPEAVVVTNPAPNATIGVSTSLTATAGGSTPISHINLYVDGISQYVSSGSNLNTSLRLTPGKHSVILQASNTSGSLVQNAFNVTAASPHISLLSPPAASASYGPTYISATTTDPTPVRAVQIYLDSSLVYEVSGTGVQTTLAVPNGQHSIVVQAWNRSGVSYKSAVAVHVIPVPITIASPGANANVLSPVHIAASAPANSPVQTMQVYVDNALAYQTSGQSANTSLSLSPGQHYLVAKGWDQSGHNWQSAEYINVK